MGCWVLQAGIIMEPEVAEVVAAAVAVVAAAVAVVAEVVEVAAVYTFLQLQ